VRRYSADEESRIRRLALIRAWLRAGLLDPSQAAALEESVQTDLKRTNTMLRLALAGFTAIVVSASIGLAVITLRIHSGTAVAALLACAAVACFGAADYLAGAVRVYRYGVEEVLAVLSPVLMAFATVSFVNSGARLGGNLDAVTALAVCAAGLFVVYARFGLVYAAVGGMICAGLTPFNFGVAPATQHLTAAAMFGAAFFTARALYRREGDDFPGDEYGLIEAAACAGAYLSLNLHVWDELGAWRWLWSTSAVGVDRWFYWASYVSTWLIPAAALADAIRAKDRRLLAVGIAAALVTLATNKPYLGIERQPWDPMILGVLLVAVAAGLRRWLANGRGGARYGYTADRIVGTDRDLLTAAANASVAWQGRINERPPADTAPPTFAGGRSGGAGGGASF
jgi:hypothetical protein